MGRRELEERIEKRREDFVRNSLLSDEFIDFVQENLKPVNTMMAYYQCAIMEVETKFKVLSEQYSLEYDRNPIESIKTRVKSMESLLKKIRRKNIPLTIDAIEENIQDIAGVRAVSYTHLRAHECSFVRSRWISGRAWSISFAIKRVFRKIRVSIWQKR